MKNILLKLSLLVIAFTSSVFSMQKRLSDVKSPETNIPAAREKNLSPAIFSKEIQEVTLECLEKEEASDSESEADLEEDFLRVLSNKKYQFSSKDKKQLIKAGLNYSEKSRDPNIMSWFSGLIEHADKKRKTASLSREEINLSLKNNEFNKIERKLALEITANRKLATITPKETIQILLGNGFSTAEQGCVTSISLLTIDLSTFTKEQIEKVCHNISQCQNLNELYLLKNKQNSNHSQIVLAFEDLTKSLKNLRMLILTSNANINDKNLFIARLNNGLQNDSNLKVLDLSGRNLNQNTILAFLNEWHK
jgi:hypothetical protein